MKPKIFIIDDDQTICFSLRTLFEEKGYIVDDAQEGSVAIKKFQEKKPGSPYRPEVVLLDVQLPDTSGIRVLEQIKAISPETCVIIITGFGSVPQSVEAMGKGAADYVLKPFNIDEILLRIDKALEGRKLKEQVGYLKDKMYGSWDAKYVMGPNSRIQEIYAQIETVSRSPNTTVLILGETGTGKEVIAQRIHNLSDRAEKPFVAVNATALSPELLESELFGHEEGSFTGAVGRKQGLFEVADGGTLFLDEIGDMDLGLQAKILRVLQERTVRRVGGTDNIDVDIRLIAATNCDLQEGVASGKFREDLYYRLAVIPLQIPPLRARADDIEPLLFHFIKEFNKELNREVTKVDPAALAALKKYSWPGNVRELRNLVERTMLLEVTGNTLQLTHIKLGGNALKRTTDTEGVPTPISSVGDTIPLETVERQHIEGVLEATNGNKNQAAQILGIDRTTLYNKLKKYKLKGV